MSNDDKAKPASSKFDLDAELADITRHALPDGNPRLVLRGDLHDPTRSKAVFTDLPGNDTHRFNDSDWSKKPLEKDMLSPRSEFNKLHRDGSPYLAHYDAKHVPATAYDNFIMYHEAKHIGEPRTIDPEVREARVSAVANMLSRPTDAHDISLATGRVMFDIFPGKTSVYKEDDLHSFTAAIEREDIARRMSSPNFAADPLKAASAVAILHGDAWPITDKAKHTKPASSGNLKHD